MSAVPNPYREDYPKPPDWLIEIKAFRMRLHRMEERCDQMEEATKELERRRFQQREAKRSALLAANEKSAPPD